MIYKNYTDKAILEMEKQRTGDYGSCLEENFNDFLCDECRTGDVMLFEVGSKILCSECICDRLREEFHNCINSYENETEFANEILDDIISDFSDNELIMYIENKYNKIS